MKQPFIEDPAEPSHALRTLTGAKDFVTTYGVPAHALRFKGTGTVTLTDKSGKSDTHDVNDGEVIVAIVKEITALGGGTTGYRAQFPATYEGGHFAEPAP